MKTFKQFLNEKALNSGVFAKTIERLSSTAKLGFELEMWVPEDSDLLIIKDEDSSIGDFDKTAMGAKKSLEGMISGEIEISTTNIDAWRIVKDGSIQDEGTGCGIEIVSPPLPIEDGLGDLKQMFKWMVKHEVVTNSTTGLHLNISIPDLSNSLDPLKLILFMGEAHVLKSYQREMNTYARKHYDDLIAGIQKDGKIPKSSRLMHRAAIDYLKKEKYRTVNLKKLDDGYLEFRTAGNEDYHKKFDQVSRDIGRFLTVLELACDPVAERKEYLKKLARLFGDAKEVIKTTGSSSRNLSNEPSPKGSLESIIGDINLSSLNVLSNTSTDSAKIVPRLSRVMNLTGRHIADGSVEVSVKNIAEFKLLLSKLRKAEPDLISKVRASASSQVELDNVKAFMKAFNLK